MNKLLAVVLVSLAIASSASAKTIRVHMYMLPWGLEGNQPVTIDEVRQHPFFKFEILEGAYADKFIASLGEGEMTSGFDAELRDVRLVIEADEDDGSTRVFFASRFAIGASDTGKGRLIDDAFRSRFSGFYFGHG